MTNTTFIGGVQGNRHLDPNRPYSGFKIAMFRWNDGDVVLVPPHYMNKESKISADSICSSKHKDSENFSKCSCGFYSYAKVSDAADHASQFDYSDDSFFIEVSLSGFVVVAEKGYKASHQRVRTIVAQPCFNCDRKNPSDMLIIAPKTSLLVPACSSCVKNSGDEYITFEEFSEKATPEGFQPIVMASMKFEGDKLNELFDNYDKNLAIRLAIRELVEDKDVASLASAAMAINEALDQILKDESSE